MLLHIITSIASSIIVIIIIIIVMNSAASGYSAEGGAVDRGCSGLG